MKDAKVKRGNMLNFEYTRKPNIYRPTRTPHCKLEKVFKKKLSCGFIFFKTVLYTYILNTYFFSLIEIIQA